jgi:hypothetical protein
VGNGALLANQANANTAVGAGTLIANTSGIENSALGYNTLGVNTAGSFNVAIGNDALAANNANYNTAVGPSVLTKNTSGAYNSAFGYNALSTNNLGVYNTAIGEGALASADANYNTAVGAAAMGLTNTGGYNTALGCNAMPSGYGNYNVAVGYSAAWDLSSSSNMTFVGTNTSLDPQPCTDGGAFGNNAVGGNYTYVIGDASTSFIGGYADWVNVSDGRFKKNISEEVVGLPFVLKLRPVQYNLDVDGIYQHTGVSGRKGYTRDAEGIQQKEERRYSGFIAQEVEQAAKESGYNFSGVKQPRNDKELYGLAYSNFVVPLVKAVQEQEQQIEEMKKHYGDEIDALKKTIEELRNK